MQSLIDRAWLRLQQVVVGRHVQRLGIVADPSVRYLGAPIVTLASDSSITIGARSVLTSRSTWTALGVNHPVVLRTLLPGAELSIGKDVGISGGSICAARRITIGDGTMAGANVTIIDTDFHPIHHEARRYESIPEPRPDDAVTIGRNVFLGTGAIILKGTFIGDDAVIGAGAVVSGHVQPKATVVGNATRSL